MCPELAERESSFLDLYGRARKFHLRSEAIAGQNFRIRRRPPNRDKRWRLSQFHAYSDVALNSTLIRRLKVCKLQLEMYMDGISSQPYQQALVQLDKLKASCNS